MGEEDNNGAREILKKLMSYFNKCVMENVCLAYKAEQCEKAMHSLTR